MDVTPAEAKVLATSAYIFTRPLVAGYGDMYVGVIDPFSRSDGGGFGRWLHQLNAPPFESDVAASHTTTLYSSAWVDVRAEPWLARFPTIDADWFHCSRTSDLWGFVIDQIAPGDDTSGPVLLTSPTWVGDVPGDADRVVRGDSAFVRTESCIQIRDPGDLARVRSIQQEYVLEPLSAHVWHHPPPPARPLHWWAYHSEDEIAEEFWSLANFALSLIVGHPQDREIFDRIARIGVVAGQPWDATSFSPDVAEAIDDGMSHALSELMLAAAGAVDPDLLHRSRFDTDRDYFNRALGSLRPGSLVGLRSC